MRIVQVTAYFQPEFGYEEYYVSRTLAQLGEDVSVITSNKIFPFKNVEKLLAEIGSEHKSRRRTTGVEKIDGFCVYRLPIVIELLTDFNLLLNVRATLKKIKPDVVHIHEPTQGGSALVALHKDLGFKLLVDQHGYATTFEETNTLKNKVAHYQYVLLRKRFGRLAFNRADAITAVTERTKQFMVDFQGIPADKIEIVPLGTDENLFKFDRLARPKLRTELNITGDTPLILTAGRIDRAKKLEQLVQAFHKLRKSLEARLLIIGSGDVEYEEKLKHLVKKLALTKSVKFINFVPKSSLARYYSAADIGFWNKASITILEAMNCRLPVVLPDQPTIRTYVTNKNGLLFPEDDVQALSDQLLKLASDKALRTAMGKRAAEIVEKNYSYKITTKKYLKIYRRLLEE